MGVKIRNSLVMGLLLLGGCSGDVLPKYALVSELRVLALKAVTPEISPGGTIGVVSALVLDPDGGGRTVTYSWVGCYEGLTASTSRFTCDDAADRVSLGTGTSSTGGIVTVPATALDGLSATRSYNGINYIVAVTVTAGSESVMAFKRIVISSKGIKNANPSITSLTRAGVALNNGDALGGETDLTLNVAAGGYESYQYKDASGGLQTSTEDLLITWFHTEGEMDVSRTFGGNQVNHWKPPGVKGRTNVTLAVVIHDGRGGIDWKQVDLQ